MCVERTLTPLCQVNSFSIQMSQRNCRQFLNSLPLSIAGTHTLKSSVLLWSANYLPNWFVTFHPSPFRSFSHAIAIETGKTLISSISATNINNSVFCSLFPECMRPFRFTLFMLYGLCDAVTNFAAVNLRFSAYKSTKTRRHSVGLQLARRSLEIKHSRITETGHSSVNEYLLAITFGHDSHTACNRF